jgi:uncharacterized protein (TIGR02271 family)
MTEHTKTEHVPLVEERLRVEKRRRRVGAVRVTSKIRERQERVDEPLIHEEVRIERVRLDRVVETMPPVRKEGETLIYPIVEETLVLEKRLVLREEVRITRERRVERFQQDVTLRAAEAVIVRSKPGQPPTEPGA